MFNQKSKPKTRYMVSCKFYQWYAKTS